MYDITFEATLSLLEISLTVHLVLSPANITLKNFKMYVSSPVLQNNPLFIPFFTSFSLKDEPGRQQPFDPISPFLGCLQPGGLDFLKISHKFLQLIEIVKQIFAVSLKRSGLLAHRAATRPGESCCCSRCRKEEGTQILSWKVEFKRRCLIYKSICLQNIWQEGQGIEVSKWRLCDGTSISTTPLWRD